MAVYTPHKSKRVHKRALKPKLDEQMSALVKAAHSHNTSAFVLAYQNIDWQTKKAEDFVQAVQLALAAGAHLAARKLASLGADRYPQNAELKKSADVLAPPKVVARNLPARPDIRLNRDWIMSQSSAYRGKWVALRNGTVLAVADSFDALADQIGNPSGVLLTKIF